MKNGNGIHEAMKPKSSGKEDMCVINVHKDVREMLTKLKERLERANPDLRATLGTVVAAAVKAYDPGLSHRKAAKKVRKVRRAKKAHPNDASEMPSGEH